MVQSSMNVRLVSNSDDQAIAIRDHILTLLRQAGAVQIQRDTVRLTELRMGVWAFRHWTPFNELGREEASSPGYRHAIERQRTKQGLPYGLDVWHGAKVLRILWAEDGTIDVASFVRGPWEDEALMLQPRLHGVQPDTQ
ncbi:MAG: hypothetical protein WB509_25550 [Acetobacteraceae bacterium]